MDLKDAIPDLKGNREDKTTVYGDEPELELLEKLIQVINRKGEA